MSTPPNGQMLPVRINKPGYGPRIISALMTDLIFGTSDLRAQPAYYRGAGAPSSSTLLAGNYSAAIAGTGYLVGDIYLDTTANNLYACSTAGSNQVGSNGGSAWTMISGNGNAGLKYFITPQNVNGSPPANTYGEISFQAADGTTIYKNPGSEFIASEIISTLTNAVVTYSNYDTVYYNSRTATSGGTSEVQYITPQYQPGQVILAAWISNSVTGAGGQLQSIINGVGPNIWVEIFPVRVWSGLNPPNNQNS